MRWRPTSQSGEAPSAAGRREEDDRVIARYLAGPGRGHDPRPLVNFVRHVRADLGPRARIVEVEIRSGSRGQQEVVVGYHFEDEPASKAPLDITAIPVRPTVSDPAGRRDGGSADSPHTAILSATMPGAAVPASAGAMDAATRTPDEELVEQFVKGPGRETDREVFTKLVRRLRARAGPTAILRLSDPNSPAGCVSVTYPKHELASLTPSGPSAYQVVSSSGVGVAGESVVGSVGVAWAEASAEAAVLAQSGFSGRADDSDGADPSGSAADGTIGRSGKGGLEPMTPFGKMA